MEPVKKSEAPDYYEVIRFPIGEDAPSRPLPSTPARKSCSCLHRPHSPL